jgi:hypothetical protein
MELLRETQPSSYAETCLTRQHNHRNTLTKLVKGKAYTVTLP